MTLSRLDTLDEEEDRQEEREENRKKKFKDGSKSGRGCSGTENMEEEDGSM